MAKKMRDRVMDTEAGKRFISWHERKVWDDYKEYCRRTAKGTSREADVERDIKRLEYMLEEYSEEKDPLGQKAMAVRVSVACLAADMPQENTPRTLKVAIDKAEGRKIIENERKADSLGIAVLAAIGGTAVAGAAFTFMAYVVATLGKYVIDHMPDHTDEDFRKLTGAIQKSYLDINLKALPDGFKQLAESGYCKITADGKILVADDPDVAIIVAECFGEIFKGTDILKRVNSGKISPKEIERMINNSYGGKLLAGTGNISMTHAAEDLSNEFAGNDLNEFVRTGMITEKEGMEKERERDA